MPIVIVGSFASAQSVVVVTVFAICVLLVECFKIDVKLTKLNAVLLKLHIVCFTGFGSNATRVRRMPG